MREVLDEAPPRPKTGFNPNLRPDTMGGKKGFSDDNGTFYEGTKEQALDEKWKYDHMQYRNKINESLAEKKSNSLKGRATKEINVATEKVKNAPENVRQAINKGEKKLKELLGIGKK